MPRSPTRCNLCWGGVAHFSGGSLRPSGRSRDRGPALKAYKDGMVLTELDQVGSKLETSLRVDRELWLFYKSLPSRMRGKILERVIRTFMKKQSEASGQGKARGSQGSSRKRQSTG